MEKELQRHNEVMTKINNAVYLSELPKVSKANITEFIVSGTKYENESLKSKDIMDIVIDLLNGMEIDSLEFEKVLRERCINLMPLHGSEAFKKAWEKIQKTDKLEHLIEEVNAKEKRTLRIYKMDHDDVMLKIENANRISELPQGLSLSKLTSYLSGNSTIYKNEKCIPAADFVEIAELLLKNKKISDEEIKYYLKQITQKYYPNKATEAYELLFIKLASLPKIKYFVIEILESQKKQEKFIENASSNVNIYLIPNPNTPTQGGLFYNCYVNRSKNLNLGEIIPPGMDVDSIEWYVQENFDPTFKTAGGIILNRDETIGNANIFKPNDENKVDITIEEKNKYEQLELLSSEVKSIIAKKREANSKFKELQNEYFKFELETNEQLEELEKKIDFLTKKNKRK